MFWLLQTTDKERERVLFKSRPRWLVWRTPLQWLQMTVMCWKASLLHHSSEQQVQTVLAWRTFLRSYELLLPMAEFSGELTCSNTNLALSSSAALVNCSTGWRGWRLLSSRSFPLLQRYDYILGYGESRMGSLFFEVICSYLISTSKAVPTVSCEW